MVEVGILGDLIEIGRVGGGRRSGGRMRSAGKGAILGVGVRREGVGRRDGGLVGRREGGLGRERAERSHGRRRFYTCKTLGERKTIIFVKELARVLGIRGRS